MAVNVSGRQLSDEGFTAFVGHQLRRLGVPPVCLTVELTETSLIADQELATRRLTELSDLGVRIAVDDYGSGHASIGYLRDFPIDIVKIDRSFVSALDDKPHEAEAYLRSITDLARGLKLNTIAEGIEHSEQLAALRQLGCDVGQGYHLARPLDAVAAAAFLAQSEAQHAERRAISN
jgi:EAL domain-containing protein (putative c-di-GMP-specific phosphodiesterase class I)